MGRGDVVVIDDGGLDSLVAALAEHGFRTRGPVVRDGAIVPGPLTTVDDLPRGWHDEQAPGRYRLVASDDPCLFSWAVGPGSWKADVFPPSEELWRARVDEAHTVTISEPSLPAAPAAVVGARPCEVAALRVLDRVLGNGSRPDPSYVGRRRAMFVVVVECGTPGGSCFCTSMGTGPGAPEGVDLALTELHDDLGHRFLARAGSDRGADLLAAVPTRPADEADLVAREELLDAAELAMGRRVEVEGLPALLVRNLEHPRWAEVSERCLSCGNCTSVCPTCFCSDVRDTTDLRGEVTRRRTWASCFDPDHSYLHGSAVRGSTSSRYRQWMTHKLATWWEQFGTSGCVGCGRCITWCPVGIDITEEVAAIRATDGARVDERHEATG